MSLLIKKILNKLKNIDENIVIGQEVKTNKKIDGQRVYLKRINCGAIPENSTKRLAHGITNFKIVKVDAIGRSEAGSVFMFPYANLEINKFTDCQVSSKEIVLQTNYNITNYTIFVDIYYVKI